MKRNLCLVLTILALSTYNAFSQTATPLQKPLPFERNLHKLMHQAHKALLGNNAMEGEGKVRNEAYVFGFAIYVNTLGIVDSVIFTNKTSLLDSIVSFSKITTSLKADSKIFQEHKNTVIVSFGLVRRDWDRSIVNVSTFTKQFLSIFPKLYPVDRSVLVVGPFDFSGLETVRD